MNKPTADWLQSIEALHDVPLSQLQWFCDNSDFLELATDEYLLTPGVPHAGTYIITSGRVRLYNLQHDEMNELAVFAEKSISGYLPFSRGLVAGLYGVAVVPTQYLCFPVGRIQELITLHFELTQALVHVMTSRVRDYTSMIRQNEKMLALGKLSAGLAHELNNPAAAVIRGAASLKQHLKLLPSGFEEIASMCMQPEQVMAVKDKLLAVFNDTEKPVLTLMQRSEQEEALIDWFDDNGISNGVALAESYIEFGFTPARLDDLKAHIPEKYLSAIFNWIDKNLVTEKLVADIDEASRRIGQLVGSVKTFTHMDQGHARQLADIHEGIENTLVILGYKLRHNNIQLIKTYGEAVPSIKIGVGEINQVWTNLIDNAVDAMAVNGNGVLEIATSVEDGCLKVVITDNGPGIPEEIKNRIFEPFFTTKEIGKGTGLGLDIALNIIRQHKGSVKLYSVPGQTSFMVYLPLSE